MAEIPTTGFDSAPYTDPAQQQAHEVALNSYYDFGDGQTPVTLSEAADQLQSGVADSIDYHNAAAYAAYDTRLGSVDGVNYVRDGDNNLQVATRGQSEILRNSLDPPLRNVEVKAPLPPLGEVEIKAFGAFLNNVMLSADKRAALNDSDQGYSGLSADTYWSHGKPVYQIDQKTGQQSRDPAGNRIEIHRSTPQREILAGMLNRYMDQHPQYAHIVQSRITDLSTNVITTTRYADAAVEALDRARSHVDNIEAERATAPKPIKELPLDPAHDPKNPVAQAKLVKARAILTIERDNADIAGDSATATAKAAELATLDAADNRYVLDDKHYRSRHNRSPHIKWLGPASLADTRPSRNQQNKLIADRGKVIDHNNYIKDLPGRIAKAQLVAEGYAAPALKQAEYLKTEDEFRLASLEDIFQGALEINKKDSDLSPAEIKAVISNIDDIEQTSTIALVDMFDGMRLNGDYNLDIEHVSVQGMTVLQGYLNLIDSNINRYFVESDEYQEISGMRAEVLGEYIGIRYRREVVRTFEANLAGDFAGRYATHFMEDGGIKVEDGTSMVLYSDQSYAIMLPGALVVARRNADGTPWNAAQAAASETIAIQPDPTTLELATQESINMQFEVAIKLWFVDQGSSSSRAAHTLAEAALTHARSDLESDGHHPTARDAIDYYAYWSSFLNTSTHDNSAGNMPHLLNNGSVEMRGTLYSDYDEVWAHGRWEIAPDGNKLLLAHETAPALPQEQTPERTKSRRVQRVRRALGQLTKREVKRSTDEELAALDELLEDYDPKSETKPA